jgi:hypothetical protein
MQVLQCAPAIRGDMQTNVIPMQQCQFDCRLAEMMFRARRLPVSGAHIEARTHCIGLLRYAAAAECSVGLIRTIE